MSSYPDECSGFPAFPEIYDMDASCTGTCGRVHIQILSSESRELLTVFSRINSGLLLFSPLLFCKWILNGSQNFREHSVVWCLNFTVLSVLSFGPFFFFNWLKNKQSTMRHKKSYQNHKKILCVISNGPTQIKLRFSNHILKELKTKKLL